MDVISRWVAREINWGTTPPPPNNKPLNVPALMQANEKF